MVGPVGQPFKRGAQIKPASMNHRNKNRGLIWSNSRKAKDTNPDYTGSLNVKGEEFWISAWKREEIGASGAESLSFSVRPKDQAPIEQPKDYVVNPGNKN